MSLPSPSSAESGIPVHVAIIMDGNGRWATARGLPRTFGHRKGADAVREAVIGAREQGVSYLTLYAFSSENWKRPASEVFDLMDLLRVYIRREIAELDRNGVRVRVIGERCRLDADLQALIADAEAQTRNNRGLTLVIALNYGGQNEIVAAARALAQEVAAGRLAPDDIDLGLFASRLETADIPDPDLVIRTSGEQRLSNFLLWQSAYAELMFLPILWPDFTRDTLARAIGDFQKRERRYGGSDG